MLLRCLTITLVFLGMAWFPPSARAFQVLNLIDNGSFEVRTAATGMPAFWRSLSTGTGVVSWLGNGAQRTGQRCIRIRNLLSGDVYVDNWDHMVPVTDGMRYDFKFALKGQGSLDVMMTWLAPRVSDSTGPLEPYVTIGPPTYPVLGQSVTTYTLADSYSTKYLSQIAPASSAFALLTFKMSGPGDCFIDDVGMWVNPGPETHRTGFVNLGPDQHLAISDVHQAETAGGSTRTTVLWDKECRATQPDLGDLGSQFIYFSVGRDFIL
jgi:hypothetical protein